MPARLWKTPQINETFGAADVSIRHVRRIPCGEDRKRCIKILGQTMKLITPLTIGLLALAMLVPCASQAQDDAADAGFFLESITPDSGDNLESLMPDPNQYELNLRLSSGLGVYRNFQRSEIVMRDAVFDTGIEEKASTGALLQLGSRTSMSFSRSDREVRDVLSQMMESRSVTAMQLTHGFGGGGSLGELSYYQAQQIDETPDLGELRTQIQRAGLQTGLGAGASFQADWETIESEEPGRLSEMSYSGALKMAMSGGEGLAQFDYLQRLVEGQSSTRRQFDIVAPFAVQGGTLMAEHHLLEETTDASTKIQRKTNLVLPLGLIRDGLMASYVEDAKILNDVRNQKSTLTFATPLSLFGHDSNLQHISTETIKGDAVTAETTVRLATQFSGGQGLLERYDAMVPVGESFEHRRRLTLQSPRISLLDRMSFAIGQVRTETVGVYESRVSHLDLKAQPFEPLDVCAQYRYYDHADGRETKDRSVQTVLALGQTATLRGQILEQEKLDDSPLLVRHVELQRTGSAESALDMRVGYTSYGDQLDENAPTMLAQVNLGDAAHLGVSALYTEYDERKLTPLAEPTTTVEVHAGDPARLGMRAGFTEHAGREQPERAIGLATQAFGGALRFDFINNPLDPRGKVVMVSDLYELGFQRTVFGGVGMDFGYKYWMPDEEQDVEQYFKLQLDGGQVDRGGKVCLSFLTGHFVPYPKKGDPPASLLDLTFEKRWPGEGRILVTVSREEAPTLSVGVDDNVEAELKYQMDF